MKKYGDLKAPKKMNDEELDMDLMELEDEAMESPLKEFSTEELQAELDLRMSGEDDMDVEEDTDLDEDEDGEFSEPQMIIGDN